MANNQKRPKTIRDLLKTAKLNVDDPRTYFDEELALAYQNEIWYINGEFSSNVHEVQRNIPQSSSATKPPVATFVETIYERNAASYFDEDIAEWFQNEMWFQKGCQTVCRRQISEEKVQSLENVENLAKKNVYGKKVVEPIRKSSQISAAESQIAIINYDHETPVENSDTETLKTDSKVGEKASPSTAEKRRISRKSGSRITIKDSGYNSTVTPSEITPSIPISNGRTQRNVPTNQRASVGTKIPPIEEKIPIEKLPKSENSSTEKGPQNVTGKRLSSPQAIDNVSSKSEISPSKPQDVAPSGDGTKTILEVKKSSILKKSSLTDPQESEQLPLKEGTPSVIGTKKLLVENKKSSILKKSSLRGAQTSSESEEPPLKSQERTPSGTGIKKSLLEAKKSSILKKSPAAEPQIPLESEEPDLKEGTPSRIGTKKSLVETKKSSILKKSSLAEHQASPESEESPLEAKKSILKKSSVANPQITSDSEEPPLKENAPSGIGTRKSLVEGKKSAILKKSSLKESEKPPLKEGIISGIESKKSLLETKKSTTSSKSPPEKTVSGIKKISSKSSQKKAVQKSSENSTSAESRKVPMVPEENLTKSNLVLAVNELPNPQNRQDILLDSEVAPLIPQHNPESAHQIPSGTGAKELSQSAGKILSSSKSVLKASKEKSTTISASNLGGLEEVPSSSKTEAIAKKSSLAVAKGSSKSLPKRSTEKSSTVSSPNLGSLQEVSAVSSKETLESVRPGLELVSKRSVADLTKTEGLPEVSEGSTSIKVDAEKTGISPKRSIGSEDICSANLAAEKIAHLGEDIRSIDADCAANAAFNLGPTAILSEKDLIAPIRSGKTKGQSETDKECAANLSLKSGGSKGSSGKKGTKTTPNPSEKLGLVSSLSKASEGDTGIAPERPSSGKKIPGKTVSKKSGISIPKLPSKVISDGTKLAPQPAKFSREDQRAPEMTVESPSPEIKNVELEGAAGEMLPRRSTIGSSGPAENLVPEKVSKKSGISLKLPSKVDSPEPVEISIPEKQVSKKSGISLKLPSSVDSPKPAQTSVPEKKVSKKSGTSLKLPSKVDSSEPAEILIPEKKISKKSAITLKLPSKVDSPKSAEFSKETAKAPKIIEESPSPDTKSAKLFISGERLPERSIPSVSVTEISGSTISQGTETISIACYEKVASKIPSKRSSPTNSGQTEGILRSSETFPVPDATRKLTGDIIIKPKSLTILMEPAGKSSKIPGSSETSSTPVPDAESGSIVSRLTGDMVIKPESVTIILEPRKSLPGKSGSRKSLPLESGEKTVRLTGDIVIKPEGVTVRYEPVKSGSKQTVIEGPPETLGHPIEISEAEPDTKVLFERKSLIKPSKEGSKHGKIPKRISVTTSVKSKASAESTKKLKPVLSKIGKSKDALSPILTGTKSGLILKTSGRDAEISEGLPEVDATPVEAVSTRASIPVDNQIVFEQRISVTTGAEIQDLPLESTEPIRKVPRSIASLLSDSAIRAEISTPPQGDQVTRRLSVEVTAKGSQLSIASTRSIPGPQVAEPIKKSPRSIPSLLKGYEVVAETKTITKTPEGIEETVTLELAPKETPDVPDGGPIKKVPRSIASLLSDHQNIQGVPPSDQVDRRLSTEVTAKGSHLSIASTKSIPGPQVAEPIKKSPRSIPSLLKGYEVAAETKTITKTPEGIEETVTLELAPKETPDVSDGGPIKKVPRSIASLLSDHQNLQGVPPSDQVGRRLSTEVTAKGSHLSIASTKSIAGPQVVEPIKKVPRSIPSLLKGYEVVAETKTIIKTPKGIEETVTLELAPKETPDVPDGGPIKKVPRSIASLLSDDQDLQGVPTGDQVERRLSTEVTAKGSHLSIASTKSIAGPQVVEPIKKVPRSIPSLLKGYEVVAETKTVTKTPEGVEETVTLELAPTETHILPRREPIKKAPRSIPSLLPDYEVVTKTKTVTKTPKGVEETVTLELAPKETPDVPDGGPIKKVPRSIPSLLTDQGYQVVSKTQKTVKTPSGKVAETVTVELTPISDSQDADPHLTVTSGRSIQGVEAKGPQKVPRSIPSLLSDQEIQKDAEPIKKVPRSIASLLTDQDYQGEVLEQTIKTELTAKESRQSRTAGSRSIPGLTSDDEIRPSVKTQLSMPGLVPGEQILVEQTTPGGPEGTKGTPSHPIVKIRRTIPSLLPDYETPVAETVDLPREKVVVERRLSAEIKKKPSGAEIKGKSVPNQIVVEKKLTGEIKMKKSPPGVELPGTAERVSVHAQLPGPLPGDQIIIEPTAAEGIGSQASIKTRRTIPSLLSDTYLPVNTDPILSRKVSAEIVTKEIRSKSQKSILEEVQIGPSIDLSIADNSQQISTHVPSRGSISITLEEEKVPKESLKTPSKVPVVDKPSQTPKVSIGKVPEVSPISEIVQESGKSSIPELELSLEDKDVKRSDSRKSVSFGEPRETKKGLLSRLSSSFGRKRPSSERRGSILKVSSKSTSPTSESSTGPDPKVTIMVSPEKKIEISTESSRFEEKAIRTVPKSEHEASRADVSGSDKVSQKSSVQKKEVVPKISSKMNKSAEKVPKKKDTEISATKKLEGMPPKSPGKDHKRRKPSPEKPPVVKESPDKMRTKSILKPSSSRSSKSKASSASVVPELDRMGFPLKTSPLKRTSSVMHIKNNLVEPIFDKMGFPAESPKKGSIKSSGNIHSAPKLDRMGFPVLEKTTGEASKVPSDAGLETDTAGSEEPLIGMDTEEKEPPKADSEEIPVKTKLPSKTSEGVKKSVESATIEKSSKMGHKGTENFISNEIASGTWKQTGIDKEKIAGKKSKEKKRSVVPSGSTAEKSTVAESERAPIFDTKGSPLDKTVPIPIGKQKTPKSYHKETENFISTEIASGSWKKTDIGKEKIAGRKSKEKKRSLGPSGSTAEKSTASEPEGALIFEGAPLDKSVPRISAKGPTSTETPFGTTEVTSGKLSSRSIEKNQRPKEISGRKISSAPSDVTSRGEADILSTITERSELVQTDITIPTDIIIRPSKITAIGGSLTDMEIDIRESPGKPSEPAQVITGTEKPQDASKTPIVFPGTDGAKPKASKKTPKAAKEAKSKKTKKEAPKVPTSTTSGTTSPPLESSGLPVPEPTGGVSAEPPTLGTAETAKIAGLPEEISTPSEQNSLQPSEEISASIEKSGTTSPEIHVSEIILQDIEDLKAKKKSPRKSKSPKKGSPVLDQRPGPGSLADSKAIPGTVDSNGISRTVDSKSTLASGEKSPTDTISLPKEPVLEKGRESPSKSRKGSSAFGDLEKAEKDSEKLLLRDVLVQRKPVDFTEKKVTCCSHSGKPKSKERDLKKESPTKVEKIARDSPDIPGTERPSKISVLETVPKSAEVPPAGEGEKITDRRFGLGKKKKEPPIPQKVPTKPEVGLRTSKGEIGTEVPVAPFATGDESPDISVVDQVPVVKEPSKTVLEAGPITPPKPSEEVSLPGKVPTKKEKTPSGRFGLGKKKTPPPSETPPQKVPIKPEVGLKPSKEIFPAVGGQLPPTTEVSSEISGVETVSDIPSQLEEKVENAPPKKEKKFGLGKKKEAKPQRIPVPIKPEDPGRYRVAEKGQLAPAPEADLSQKVSEFPIQSEVTGTKLETTSVESGPSVVEERGRLPPKKTISDHSMSAALGPIGKKPKIKKKKKEKKPIPPDIDEIDQKSFFQGEEYVPGTKPPEATLEKTSAELEITSSKVPKVYNKESPTKRLDLEKGDTKIQKVPSAESGPSAVESPDLLTPKTSIASIVSIKPKKGLKVKKSSEMYPKKPLDENQLPSGDKPKEDLVPKITEEPIRKSFAGRPSHEEPPLPTGFVRKASGPKRDLSPADVSEIEEQIIKSHDLEFPELSTDGQSATVSLRTSGTKSPRRTVNEPIFVEVQNKPSIGDPEIFSAENVAKDYKKETEAYRPVSDLEYPEKEDISIGPDIDLKVKAPQVKLEPRISPSKTSGASAVQNVLQKAPLESDDESFKSARSDFSSLESGSVGTPTAVHRKDLQVPTAEPTIDPGDTKVEATAPKLEVVSPSDKTIFEKPKKGKPKKVPEIETPKSSKGKSPEVSIASPESPKFDKKRPRVSGKTPEPEPDLEIYVPEVQVKAKSVDLGKKGKISKASGKVKEPVIQMDPTFSRFIENEALGESVSKSPGSPKSSRKRSSKKSPEPETLEVYVPEIMVKAKSFDLDAEKPKSPVVEADLPKPEVTSRRGISSPKSKKRLGKTPEKEELEIIVPEVKVRAKSVDLGVETPEIDLPNPSEEISRSIKGSPKIRKGISSKPAENVDIYVPEIKVEAKDLDLGKKRPKSKGMARKKEIVPSKPLEAGPGELKSEEPSSPDRVEIFVPEVFVKAKSVDLGKKGKLPKTSGKVKEPDQTFARFIENEALEEPKSPGVPSKKGTPKGTKKGSGIRVELPEPSVVGPNEIKSAGTPSEQSPEKVEIFVPEILVKPKKIDTGKKRSKGLKKVPEVEKELSTPSQESSGKSGTLMPSGKSPEADNLEIFVPEVYVKAKSVDLGATKAPKVMDAMGFPIYNVEPKMDNMGFPIYDDSKITGKEDLGKTQSQQLTEDSQTQKKKNTKPVKSGSDPLLGHKKQNTVNAEHSADDQVNCFGKKSSDAFQDAYTLAPAEKSSQTGPQVNSQKNLETSLHSKTKPAEFSGNAEKDDRVFLKSKSKKAVKKPIFGTNISATPKLESETPKISPDGTKEESGSPKVDLGTTQVDPKASKTGAKASEIGPRTSKMGPKVSKKGPKASKTNDSKMGPQASESSPNSVPNADPTVEPDAKSVDTGWTSWWFGGKPSQQSVKKEETSGENTSPATKVTQKGSKMDDSSPKSDSEDSKVDPGSPKLISKTSKIGTKFSNLTTSKDEGVRQKSSGKDPKLKNSAHQQFPEKVGAASGTDLEPKTSKSKSKRSPLSKGAPLQEKNIYLENSSEVPVEKDGRSLPFGKKEGFDRVVKNSLGKKYSDKVLERRHSNQQYPERVDTGTGTVFQKTSKSQIQDLDPEHSYKKIGTTRRLNAGTQSPIKSDKKIPEPLQNQRKLPSKAPEKQSSTWGFGSWFGGGQKTPASNQEPDQDDFEKASATGTIVDPHCSSCCHKPEEIFPQLKSKGKIDPKGSTKSLSEKGKVPKGSHKSLPEKGKGKFPDSREEIEDNNDIGKKPKTAESPKNITKTKVVEVGDNKVSKFPSWFPFGRSTPVPEENTVESNEDLDSKMSPKVSEEAPDSSGSALKKKSSKLGPSPGSSTSEEAIPVADKKKSSSKKSPSRSKSPFGTSSKAPKGLLEIDKDDSLEGIVGPTDPTIARAEVTDKKRSKKVKFGKKTASPLVFDHKKPPKEPKVPEKPFDDDEDVSGIKFDPPEKKKSRETGLDKKWKEKDLDSEVGKKSPNISASSSSKSLGKKPKETKSTGWFGGFFGKKDMEKDESDEDLETEDSERDLSKDSRKLPDSRRPGSRDSRVTKELTSDDFKMPKKRSKNQLEPPKVDLATNKTSFSDLMADMKEKEKPTPPLPSKSGSPRSGSPKSGSPRSGSPKSGSPRSGSPKNRSPRHSESKPTKGKSRGLKAKREARKASDAGPSDRDREKDHFKPEYRQEPRTSKDFGKKGAQNGGPKPQKIDIGSFFEPADSSGPSGGPSAGPSGARGRRDSDPGRSRSPESGRTPRTYDRRAEPPPPPPRRTSKDKSKDKKPKKERRISKEINKRKARKGGPLENVIIDEDYGDRIILSGYDRAFVYPRGKEKGCNRDMLGEDEEYDRKIFSGYDRAFARKRCVKAMFVKEEYDSPRPLPSDRGGSGVGVGRTDCDRYGQPSNKPRYREPKYDGTKRDAYDEYWDRYERDKQKYIAREERRKNKCLGWII